jgi:hypothetical protein
MLGLQSGMALAMHGAAGLKFSDWLATILGSLGLVCCPYLSSMVCTQAYVRYVRGSVSQARVGGAEWSHVELTSSAFMEAGLFLDVSAGVHCVRPLVEHSPLFRRALFVLEVHDA